MRYVDFDATEARRARRACRAAADELRHLSSSLRRAFGRTWWEGQARRDAEASLVRLCRALTAEAEALEATARGIDRALDAAEDLDDARRAAAAGRAAEAATASRARSVPVGGSCPDMRASLSGRMTGSSMGPALKSVAW